MMSAICEAWGIMRKMGMDYEEIGDVLSEWNSEGELVCLRFMTLEAFLTNYNREAPSLSPVVVSLCIAGCLLVHSDMRIA